MYDDKCLPGTLQWWSYKTWEKGEKRGETKKKLKKIIIILLVLLRLQVNYKKKLYIQPWARRIDNFSWREKTRTLSHSSSKQLMIGLKPFPHPQGSPIPWGPAVPPRASRVRLGPAQGAAQGDNLDTSGWGDPRLQSKNSPPALRCCLWLRTGATTSPGEHQQATRESGHNQPWGSAGAGPATPAAAELARQMAPSGHAPWPRPPSRSLRPPRPSPPLPCSTLPCPHCRPFPAPRQSPQPYIDPSPALGLVVWVWTLVCLCRAGPTGVKPYSTP